MSRADSDRAQELFSELLGAVCRDTGLREDLAMPFVTAAFAYLQATYGGQRVYWPAAERRHNVLQMRADLERGKTKAAICRDHNISRATLRRLLNLPGCSSKDKR